ncbi:hypothetical protein DNTS_015411 [Danionella cerebrum]|uniref:Uncharacterized protein n=1 Tax=Danionella cerebrum TaxID=2873325 RepID=A0A553R3S6_9TELE|nr:hypothetical protein DNTS_015411 [Danionella translucida]
MDSVSLITWQVSGSPSTGTGSPSLSMSSSSFSNDTDSTRSSSAILHWNFFLASNHISTDEGREKIFLGRYKIPGLIHVEESTPDGPLSSSRGQHQIPIEPEMHEPTPPPAPITSPFSTSLRIRFISVRSQKADLTLDSSHRGSDEVLQIRIGPPSSRTQSLMFLFELILLKCWKRSPLVLVWSQSRRINPTSLSSRDRSAQVLKEHHEKLRHGAVRRRARQTQTLSGLERLLLFMRRETSQLQIMEPLLRESASLRMHI